MAKPPERTELKPGIFCTVTDAVDGQKTIAFQNMTKDTQFNIQYTFSDGAAVTPLGETKCKDGVFATAVYPGESRAFVTGKWKSYKRGLSFGPPDDTWEARQAAVRNAAVDEEIVAVKTALKAAPSPGGKYTAEYIADACEAAGIPFVDLTFPPKPSSLARDYEGTPPLLVWMRPFVYCTDPVKPPCLFVDAIEPNDIDQGSLGNCYFLCALACISEFPDLVRHIFRLPQNPRLGIYRISMVKNAWMQTVVVDDLVPTSHMKPSFAKNREEPNELWVSLVEKAYAKLHGSYFAIRAGDPAQAVADMLGTPYEKLKDSPIWADKDALFLYLEQCDRSDYIMVCGTPGSDTTHQNNDSAMQALSQQYEVVGLVTGHAFSLIAVKQYDGERLCLLRNPWGNGREWNGDWSDRSSKWTPAAKAALGFSGVCDDGLFWMPWADVVRYFDSISVAYWLPTYSQVRVAANFDGGFVDCVLQIQVTSKAVKVYCGCHQRDARGLPTGDPDRAYAPVMASIVHDEAEDGGRKHQNCKVVGSSQKASFVPARDHLVVATLEPSPRPYHFLAQTFGDTCKSCTLTLFVDDPTGVRVSFVATAADAPQRKFNPPSTFRASACNQRVAARYQLLTPSMDWKHADMKGEAVVWGGPAALAALGPSVAVPKALPAPSAAAPPPVVAMPAPAATSRPLKLSVTVLAGRKLVAKDIGGKSDPFVVLSLLDARGQPVPGTDEFTTKYQKNTLNPTWGEVFMIKVNADDRLHVHCWDKDVFGRDDMGCFELRLDSLGLAPGGPGKIDWYPLKGGDATGDIQLMLGWS